MRHVHSVALNDAEEQRLVELRGEGNSLMDVVRAGLFAGCDVHYDEKAKVTKVIKTKEEEHIHSLLPLMNTIKTKSDAEKAVSNLGGYGKYGCGCEKDGGNLCQKHGRV
jgi:hypothetical protein